MLETKVLQVDHNILTPQELEHANKLEEVSRLVQSKQQKDAQAFKMPWTVSQFLSVLMLLTGQDTLQEFSLTVEKVSTTQSC